MGPGDQVRVPLEGHEGTVGEERELLLRVRAEKAALVDFLRSRARFRYWLDLPERDADLRSYAALRQFWLRQFDGFRAQMRRRIPEDREYLRGERALRMLFESTDIADCLRRLEGGWAHPALEHASQAADRLLERYAQALDREQRTTAAVPAAPRPRPTGLIFAVGLLALILGAATVLAIGAPRREARAEEPVPTPISPDTARSEAPAPARTDPASPVPTSTPSASPARPSVVLSAPAGQPCSIALPTSGARLSPPTDLLGFLREANLVDFDVLANDEVMSLPFADAEREVRRRISRMWVGQAQDCLWSSGIRPYLAEGIREDPARRGEVDSSITCVLRHGATSWWVYSRNEPWPSLGLTRSGQPVPVRGFIDQTYLVERVGASLFIVGWTPAAPPGCR